MEQQRKKKGFALLTPEQRKERARMGGLAVPSEKRFFAQAPDEAKIAGQKGLDSRAARKSKDVIS